MELGSFRGGKWHDCIFKIFIKITEKLIYNKVKMSCNYEESTCVCRAPDDLVRACTVYGLRRHVFDTAELYCY